METLFIQPFEDLPRIDYPTGNNTSLDTLQAVGSDINNALLDSPVLTLNGREMIPHTTSMDGTTHLQLQLSKMELSAKGYPYYPPYPALDNEHGSMCCIGPMIGMEMDMFPYILRQERYSSPSGHWGGDLSSNTESESSLSPRWNNLGCYAGPPYSPEEPSFQPMYQGGFGGVGRSCDSGDSVALSEVQHYPDPEPDRESEPEQNTVSEDLPCRPRCHDELEAEGDADADGDVDIEADVSAHDNGDDDPTYLPSRKVPKISAASSPRRCRGVASATNRVGKRAIKRTTVIKPFKAAPKDQAAGRLFVCSFSRYGCGSTFVSKNEWKRHVVSQHLQLGYYRCDVGSCNVSKSPQNRRVGGNTKDNGSSSSAGGNRMPNDFNRKDLFTQHQRRMHAPWLNESRTPTQEERNAFELSLEEVRTRCWHEERQPPQQSQCGFCKQKFTGRHSWDGRMEHVGKHFEKGEWQGEAEDIDLRAWALKEGIICPVGKDQWRLSSLVRNDRSGHVV
ncbi:hypothetical protein VTN00DRAFT_5236 [Thermoascus crustaceus]|uniref:uncharacterized protein n=1 Tax=Thermoascus crustaceus TaxID=5088 RepID=UPI003742DA4C